MAEPSVVFNPRPNIERVSFAGNVSCIVVDDVLLEPDRIVDYACEQRASFSAAPFNAYPGLEFPTRGVITERLNELFMSHIRRALGGRRTLRMYSRLSMVTLPPSALQARQTICHRDNQGVDSEHLFAACVLYLFRDESLGGTSFFMPTRSAHETALLIHDSSTLSIEAFGRRRGITQAYCTDSNDYFQLLGTIPAKWNRAIFYDGGIFHSGAITAPEKLSDDPRRGRLTLNGFFECSRAAR